MDISEVVPTKSARRGLVLPFLDTSFGTDLRIILILWPVWWIFGVEQFIPPIFLVWEMSRFIIQNRGKIKLHPTILWATMLAIWWIIPILWVQYDHLDIFLRELTTAWAQVFVLILFWNLLRSNIGWYKVLSGLLVFGIYQVIGSLIYLTGLYRSPITSIIGMVLPASLTTSSEFFYSISYRNLGALSPQKIIFPYRVSGFALQVSGLSMICLLLMPLVLWQFMVHSGLAGSNSANFNRVGIKNTKLLLISGMFLLLIGFFITFLFTESRTAYLAITAGFTLFWILRFNILSKRNRSLFFAILALSFASLIITSFLSLREIIEIIRFYFVETRSGSWFTRLTIYQETIRLLKEHPIAGWGQAIPIEGLRTVFSAGTHSSYLGMLFQHGIVGLFLYIGLWLSIWHIIIRGLRRRSISLSLRYFWISMAVALISFNIRELAGNWFWDQSITITIWTMWGLVITAPKFSFQNSNPQRK